MSNVDDSKKVKIALTIALISILLLVLVRTNLLPEAVQETICGWFTSSTRNALGDFCN